MDRVRQKTLLHAGEDLGGRDVRSTKLFTESDGEQRVVHGAIATQWGDMKGYGHRRETASGAKSVNEECGFRNEDVDLSLRM